MAVRKGRRSNRFHPVAWLIFAAGVLFLPFTYYCANRFGTQGTGGPGGWGTELIIWGLGLLATPSLFFIAGTFNATYVCTRKREWVGSVLAGLLCLVGIVFTVGDVWLFFVML